jgi:hypothetical protein
MFISEYVLRWIQTKEDYTHNYKGLGEFDAVLFPFDNVREMNQGKKACMAHFQRWNAV